MNPIDALNMLASGKRPKGALLPPCRLEGMGIEAYGEEAVVNHFRHAPLVPMDAADVLVSSGHAALFAGDAALFADIYDGGILRIWRLGSGEPCGAEPSIGVPFDTDLCQARQDFAMRHEDHPELADAACDTVSQIGYRIAHDWSEADGAPSWRVRPYLLRAFSNGRTGAALFAVHRLGSGGERSVGFAFAAARFVFGIDASCDPQIVRDLAGEKAVEGKRRRTSFA